MERRGKGRGGGRGQDLLVLVGVDCARRYGGRGGDDAALYSKDRVESNSLLIAQVVTKFWIIKN